MMRRLVDQVEGWPRSVDAQSKSRTNWASEPRSSTPWELGSGNSLGAEGCSAGRRRTGVVGAAPGAAAGGTGKRQRRQRPADDVDEDGGRTVNAGEIALKHIHVEGQPIAFQLRRLQDNDHIADIGAILAEPRHGGVRRIAGKIVAAFRPIFDDVRREIVPGGTDRA